MYKCQDCAVCWAAKEDTKGTLRHESGRGPYIGEQCVHVHVHMRVCLCVLDSCTNVMIKFGKCITHIMAAHSLTQIGIYLGQKLNSRQPTYMGAILGQLGHMVTLHSAWQRKGQKAS